MQSSAHAQNDTIPQKLPADTATRLDTISRKSVDEYLKTRKGFLGKMMKGLTRDTTDIDKANQLLRNDEPYKQFQGYVIRTVHVTDLRFGTPISDPDKKTRSGLVRLANVIHHATRVQVIKNNLFFKAKDTVRPFLLADNVTFLRQLPYVQDATINIVPVDDYTDSVDIYVYVKDLFSLGISVGSLDLHNTDISVGESNISGSGNSVVLHGLYDMSRKKNFGSGFEYTQRNIGGSFFNAYEGYQSYHSGIQGLKQEQLIYAIFSKPLVNRYKHWTYELDGFFHTTSNLYTSDSLYNSNLKYRYYNVDAWIGYNLHATKYTTENEDKKLRKLIAVRGVNQNFLKVPGIYKDNYNWRYASFRGGMASVSFYRQNFYKSQYIYAFGINEDIPEGLNLTLTGGYITKEHITRPYVGFNYQRSAFNKKKNYVSYIVRAEGYLNHNSIEDINIFGAIDYFDHLKSLGAKWKQRTFVNIGFARQVNTILNEPLYIDSKFALPAYRNGDVGGSLRATVKAESVFYSPWVLGGFKFAPFAFGDAGLFTPYNTTSNIYTLVGGGLRTRNESLIFGTFEFKGYYFLKRNIYNENWRFDISTNITFKYNSQLARKPNFIEVN